MRLKFVVACFLFVAACSDTAGENNGVPECAQGERYNPVTGACELRAAMNNGEPDGGGDDNNVDRPDGGGGGGNNGGLDAGTDAQVDPGDLGDQRCAAGRDDDGDGLTNDCECVLAIDPAGADTDGDGLDDGEEDANKNCRVDPGVETDPRSSDTDVDGAPDGDELAAGTDPLAQDTDGDGVLDGVELSACLDPLMADTDGDGLPDGVEDANGDGEIGTCANRAYAPDCAAGESDPCAADTDGDGKPDSDEAQYRDCRPEDLQNLATPQFLTSMAADYKLALEQGVVTSVATSTGGGLNAHVFEEGTIGYTGFVASLDPSGQTNPSLVADAVVGLVQTDFAKYLWENPELLKQVTDPAQLVEQEFRLENIVSHRRQAQIRILRRGFGVLRFFVECQDALAAIHAHYAEVASRLRQRRLQAGYRHVCIGLCMIGEHVPIVLPVDMVAGKNHHVLRNLAANDVDILEHRIRCAHVPVV